MTNLVLIPGLLCDHRLWAHQTQYLADVANCIVPDTTGASSMEELAQSVLAQAPPRFALAGLSMGGIIAHAIMAQAPSRVEKLAFVGSTARADTPEQTTRRKNLIALAEDGRFREVSTLLMPALLHPSRLAETELTDTVYAMADAIGPRAFIQQVTAVMKRPERLGHLHHYQLPTLLICGREDAITPLDMHTEVAARVPGARLAVIEQCGHLATMERPQAVTALLRQWLEYG